MPVFINSIIFVVLEETHGDAGKHHRYGRWISNSHPNSQHKFNRDIIPGDPPCQSFSDRVFSGLFTGGTVNINIFQCSRNNISLVIYVIVKRPSVNSPV